MDMCVRFGINSEPYGHFNSKFCCRSGHSSFQLRKRVPTASVRRSSVLLVQRDDHVGTDLKALPHVAGIAVECEQQGVSTLLTRLQNPEVGVESLVVGTRPAGVAVDSRLELLNLDGTNSDVGRPVRPADERLNVLLEAHRSRNRTGVLDVEHLGGGLTGCEVVEVRVERPLEAVSIVTQIDRQSGHGDLGTAVVAGAEVGTGRRDEPETDDRSHSQNRRAEDLLVAGGTGHV